MVDDLDKLLKEIELLRTQMIQTVSEKGFTCEESIKISQKLDDRINQYQKESLRKRCVNSYHDQGK